MIEDCAQTLGAMEQGRAAGSVGRLTVCSFYATKLLCTGEGGMVLSRDRSLLERMRRLREYEEAGEDDPAKDGSMGRPLPGIQTRVEDGDRFAAVLSTDEDLDHRRAVLELRVDDQAHAREQWDEHARDEVERRRHRAAGPLPRGRPRRPPTGGVALRAHLVPVE